MLITGIIVLCIASILRAWGGLNYKERMECERPLGLMGLKGNLILVIVTDVSIVLGLVGAILVGYTTSLYVGLILFVAFWFLSGIWVPLLESLRL
jgi:hypothetical protein